jgi:hypothetical protein
VSRRFHPAIRIAALLLSAGCLAAGSPSLIPSHQSLPATVPRAWDATIDSLPDAARRLLHPTTAQLPPFPGENPAALDPGSWAPSASDSDRVCALELRTYVRGTPVNLRDIRQRKPGQSVSARYLCGSRKWRGPRYSGPFYVWDGNNQLTERSYRTTDGSRYRDDLYQYRGNGLLWAYRRRERNEDQTGPGLTLDEYFDPDGRLAGFSLEKTAPDSLVVRWRRGARVEEEAFRKWAGEFR